MSIFTCNAPISWLVTGKIHTIKHTGTFSGANTQTPNLEFGYDAMGNRVVKIVKEKNENGQLKPSNEWKYTYYIRDPQGNVMAVYERNKKSSIAPTSEFAFVDELKVSEHHIYGSSRLGSNYPDKITSHTSYNLTGDSYLYEPLPTTALAFSDPNRTLGNKKYELTNHLSNILVVITDMKYPSPTASRADLTLATDYYPFGSAMPGRSFSEGEYRFGFQGQEKDDELKGEGNSINYKYRMHDARIGRFFAVDPLAASFPWNSSYAFSENRVVDAVELEGLEATSVEQIKQAPLPYLGFWKSDDVIRTVEITIKAEVNNLSSMPNNILNDVVSNAEEIINDYKGSINDIDYSVNANILIGEGSSSWVIKVLDEREYNEIGNGALIGTLGYTTKIGDTNNNVFYLLNTGEEEQMTRTMVHELGHGLGLHHPDRTDQNGNLCFVCPFPVITEDDDKMNVMRQTKHGRGTNLHPKQIEKTHETIKNNGGNTEEDKTWPRK